MPSPALTALDAALDRAKHLHQRAAIFRDAARRNSSIWGRNRLVDAALAADSQADSIMSALKEGNHA